MNIKQIEEKVILVLSAAVALLYIYTAYAGQLMVYQQRGILLAFCFILIFLKRPMFKGSRRAWWTIAIDVLLCLFTVLSVLELIKIEAVTPFSGYYVPTGLDYVLVVGLILAILEATRRAIGLVLPVLTILVLLYAIFGNHLPGLLKHLDVSLAQILYYLGMTTEGIFGLPMYVVSTVVILFLIFSSLLDQCGLLDFFLNLANGLVGRYRGGPAKIAVISSSIMATMSGSAVANVVSTGSFTIPLMKRSGYSADFAGAVEANASTGGVITPPVMGAAAFIIAEYLGISYWAVCVAAIVPSFLYYLSLFVGVDLEAGKKGLIGLNKDQIPSISRLVWRYGYMMLPIVIMIYFLGVVNSSAMMAGFWSIISVLVLAMIRRETRVKFAGLGLIKGFSNGIRDAVVVVATCACAGIIVGVIVVTGLGFRMSYVLVELSGGNVILLLLFCAIVSLILGMGMTSTSVYLLMAVVVAPAIIQTGVDPLAAHLFVFFFGNLSHITPPVCVSVFAACGISGGDSFKTSLICMRMGIILFFVPFFFALNPTLIMQGGLLDVAFSVITAIIGVVALSFSLNNFSWLGTISFTQRLLFGLGGLAMIYPGAISSIIGAVMVSLALVIGYLRKMRLVREKVGLNP